MEALFYAVPVLMIAFAVLGLVSVARRARRVRGAWDSGLTAEARCLRTYTTTSGGGADTSVSTTLHHVYEFRTREGRGVRFEETGGPGTVLEGDVVTVHYRAERPEEATAHTPARRGRLAAEQGCVFAFLGVFIALCLTFMAVAHMIFSATDDFMP
ncbi:DUF3592 domain-containing protein [Streptomyces sp. SID10815]|uniref:DUF3592 domain-containing protein n=1 Tax=Streptomyces sp. SID10815 TaxID=2706027 RepID=UPI0013C54E0C|nr:DUF3592 domain-containing protein [Streptomyces sp. SID10815]NEA50673.1 hypothetical protein [Streptomyces sp. SID10815]